MVNDSTLLPREHRVSKEFNDILGKEVYRVHNLPFFATHEREHNGTVYNVDSEWMSDAGNWLKARRDREGWLPAVHIDHHSPFKPGSNQRLAYLDYQHTARAELEGEMRDVMFGDYLVETEEDLAELEKRPYRSPEADLDRRRIGSVAVLESEEPWFHMPIPKLQRDANYKRSQSEDFGLVACAGGGDSYSALYRFPKAGYAKAGHMLPKEMMDEDPTKGEKNPDYMGEEKPEMPMDEMNPEAEEQDDDAKMDEHLEKLAQILAPRIAAKLKPAIMNAAGLAEDPSNSPIALSSAGEKAQYSTTGGDDVGDYAKYKALEAKYAALEGHVAALAAQTSRSRTDYNVDKAINWARTKTLGLVVPAGFEETVAKYAAKNSNLSDEHNALVAYVSAIADGAPDLPPEETIDVPHELRTDSPTVAQYASGDPRALRVARKAVATYNALTPSLRARQDQDKWVQRALARAGIKVN